MKLFHKIAFASLLSVSTFGFSQNSRANQLLDAVAKNYLSKKNVYFKFIHSVQGQNKKTGIFYATPSQYLLKIMDVEQIFDGNKIYNINRNEQEITIAKPKAGDKMLSPISYLENYRHQYTLSHMGKKTNLEIVKLTPRNTNNGKTIILHINPSTSTINRVEETGAQNQQIDIVAFKANQNLPASTFIFNKANYKNYLITEL